MIKNKKKSTFKFYKFIKNLFDLLFSFLFLITFLPLFLIITLLIKFSSRGPIFFLQKRIGKNNVQFKCIKFRTMYPEAKDILENLLMKDSLLKKGALAPFFLVTKLFVHYCMICCHL